MQLMLSAMSAGGLVGAADQYLCLLLISLAARFDWIRVSPQATFMESTWFIVLITILWIITIAPAYASLLAPSVMNFINAVINFMSGFVVPISSGLIALASVGIISDLNPEAYQMLDTLQLFGAEGGAQSLGLLTAQNLVWIIAGGAAITATILTAMKAITKPALSAATGTFGTASAPIYATLENIMAVLVMGLVYILATINPWLLFGLLVIVTMITIGLLAYAIYLVWKLGKGIGQLMRLIQSNPKAGLAVLSEFFIWGSGWLIWSNPKRGLIMLTLWILYALLWWLFFGLAALVPILLVIYIPLSLLIFTLIGIFSARGLMRKFDIEDAGIFPMASSVPA